MYMISVYLQGGLGNQLFQIFTCISYALDKKTSYRFTLYNQNSKNPRSAPTELYPNGHPRPTYWNSFLSELEKNTIENEQLYQLINNVHSELTFDYYKLPNIDNFMLVGYWQSYKYFEKNFQQILQIIKIDRIRDVINQKYKNILTDNTISLQFRLGDYKKRTSTLYGYHPVIAYEYPEFYIDSINHITNTTNVDNYTILYFCEEQDHEFVKKEINKLEKLFVNCKFIRKASTDWEEMTLMSLCNHNVINNSSFGWWAAYLNYNKNKIVCYPEAWFGKQFYIDKYKTTGKKQTLSTLCPDDWKKIECKDYKDVIKM